MQLKKILCGITAAAISLGTMTAYVGAEEAKTLPEVVTAPISQIHNAESSMIYDMGRGIFGYNISGSEKKDVDGFVYIDVEKFAETGELSFTDIEFEGLDLMDDTVGYGVFTDTTFDDGDYVTMYSFDENGEQTSRFAVKYDEESGTLSKFRDLENKVGQIISSSGMSVSAEVDTASETCTVTVTKSDGTTFENTFCGVQFGTEFYTTNIGDIIIDNIIYRTQKSDKYCYCITFRTKYNEGIIVSSSGGITAGVGEIGGYYDYECYVVDTDGRAIKVDDGKLNKYSSSGMSLISDGNIFVYYYRSALAGSDSVAFVSIDGSLKRYFYIRNPRQPDANAILKDDIEPFATLDGKSLSTLPTELYNDVVIAEFDDNVYALFDYKNNKVLGECYASITTEDNGKTFLVKTGDGKWGYIDSTGKELGMFDDAGAFIGGYAPVITEGKVYFVDKELNIVSDGIEADSVYSVAENLAVVTSGSETLLATFKNLQKPTDLEFNDPETDIAVTAPDGAFADTVKLTVISKSSGVYDITFVDKNGKTVQPNDKVTVKIPVPETLAGKTVYVFRSENGKYIDMNAKVEDGYAVFVTDHFSEYIITDEKLDEAGSGDTNSTEAPGTSDNTDNSDSSSGTTDPSDINAPTGIAISLLPIVAAATVLVISRRRK